MIGANHLAGLGEPAAGPGAASRLDGGYELRVRGGPQGFEARVASRRHAGALRIAEGRKAGEALGLAGMLSPQNAAAQTAAALSAAEAALRVAASPAQTAARQLVVGLEAAAACAWRMGLAWPQLTGASAHPELVQIVRAASDAVAGALFAEGDWARLGGARVRPRPVELLELVDAVRRALRALSASVEAVAPHAPPLLGLDGRAWPLLDETGVERAALALADDPGFALRPHLSARAVEETPRALLQMWRTEEGLATWFLAQARFAERLPDRLDRTLRAVGEADPGAANAKGSGKGWGMAVTSRGRIVHWMAIEQGRIAAWRAIEPTDWNFAPRGPAARAVEHLPPDIDLADGGRWIVAAFDPSAPCRVAVAEEDELGLEPGAPLEDEDYSTVTDFARFRG